MVRRIVAVVAVAFVLSGCTHVRRIDPVASASELDDLNRALQRRRVSVELVSRYPWGLGEKLVAEGVCVAADSTSLTLLLEPADFSALWGVRSYGVKRDTTLSTSAISRMTTTNRFRGALDGTLLGLGIGVVFGALLFAGIDEPSLEPGEAAAIGSVVLGIIGTGIGLVTGTIVGSRDAYDFVDR